MYPEEATSDGGLCPHMDEGINLDKLSAKLGCSESLECEFGFFSCGGLNSNKDSEAIWICLGCGFFSCGGFALPATPQSHAVCHAERDQHPLAVHYKNHRSIWCFPCNKFISSKKFQDDKTKAVFRILRGRSSEGHGSSSVGVETSAIESESGYSVIFLPEHEATLVKEVDNKEATCNGETHGNGVPSIKDRGICPHINKGIDFDKLSAKLSSSGSIECECSWGPAKHGKMGGVNSNPKAIWICLGCAFFSCGGLMIPVTPQSHAVSHAKRWHHPLAVHHKKHKLIWCFPCEKVITSEMRQDGETKVVLNEVSRILRGQSRSEGQGSSVDSKSTSGVRRECAYSVRGLANLGNTCFFNSIVQNLLAIKSLRGYLFGLKKYLVGPLTSSFRNLLDEMSNEYSFMSAINPGSLFFSLCMKAPEFRGYGQHDSHELLRCLLDGLSNEELKRRNNNNNHNILSRDIITGPTFVDTIFGGEISSTVSCLECGHSSTICEAILDLSLSVRTKKSIITRSVPPVSQCEKYIPPHKRGAGYISKFKGEASVFLDESNDDSCLDEVQSITAQPLDESVLSSGDYELSDIALDMGLTAEDLSSIIKPENKQEVESFEKKSDPLPPNETNVALTESDIAVILGFSKIEVPQNVVSLSLTPESRIEGDPVNTISASSLEDSKTLKIQDSNKEDASSSVETNDELSLIGDFFNEPSENGQSVGMKNRVIGIKNEESESDAEEVDTGDDDPVSVESCLAFFTKPEILSKEEHAWQCDNCSKILQEQMSGLETTTSNGFNDENPTEKDLVSKEEVKSENMKVKRDAIKSVLISKAPSILTVHLKRFRQDHRGRFSKLNGHVKFGETIDLKPYMDPRSNERETYEYRLVGVVEHTGSMKDGHYVAYVRSSKEGGDCVWYYASDAAVWKASLEEVLRCQAYILFYEAA